MGPRNYPRARDQSEYLHEKKGRVLILVKEEGETETHRQRNNNERKGKRKRRVDAI